MRWNSVFRCLLMKTVDVESNKYYSLLLLFSSNYTQFLAYWLSLHSFEHFNLLQRAFSNRGKAFDFRQMNWPPLDLPPSKLPFLPMLCFPSQGLPCFTPTAFSLDSAILHAGCMSGLFLTSGKTRERGSYLAGVVLIVCHEVPMDKGAIES